MLYVTIQLIHVLNFFSKEPIDTDIASFKLVDAFDAHGPLSGGWTHKDPWASKHFFKVKTKEGISFNSLYAGGPFFTMPMWMPQFFGNGDREILLTTEFEDRDTPVVVSQYMSYYDKKTGDSSCSTIVLRTPHSECISEFENPADLEANLDFLRMIYGKQFFCKLQPKLEGPSISADKVAASAE